METQLTKRELNERRIASATRGLRRSGRSDCIFAAAAAHNTRAAGASTGDDSGAVGEQSRVDDDASGSWSLSPSPSDPQQSFDPPVASSGARDGGARRHF